jgi:hypothetical protein
MRPIGDLQATYRPYASVLSRSDALTRVDTPQHCERDRASGAGAIRT